VRIGAEAAADCAAQDTLRTKTKGRVTVGR